MKPTIPDGTMLKELKNFVCELLFEIYGKEQCEAEAAEITINH